MCLSRPISYQQQKPYFYYSEQKAGGSPEEQTVINTRSRLNFRNPELSQLYPLKTYKRGAPALHFQFSKEPMNVEDMASRNGASFEECGVLYETLSDLQNHVRNWCYGQSDRKMTNRHVIMMSSKIVI